MKIGKVGLLSALIAVAFGACAELVVDGIYPHLAMFNKEGESGTGAGGGDCRRRRGPSAVSTAPIPVLRLKNSKAMWSRGSSTTTSPAGAWAARRWAVPIPPVGSRSGSSRISPPRQWTA